MGKVKFDQLLGRPVLHVHDPLYLRDVDGVEWTLTIHTDGSLITTRLELVQGGPFGPWLWLTYP